MMPQGYKRCAGWWEQGNLGRQPMHDLHLNFDGSIVTGSGEDVVAAFLFMGTLSAGGRVRLTKQYVAGHRVTYRGDFDGNRRFTGIWNLAEFYGRWEIVILDEDQREQEAESSRERTVAESLEP